MWERQFERGRWNGHVLNILGTAIDGGQRLHISEIPYGDLPHVRVMGRKARTLKLDVVFVGRSSLVDANAFIATIDSQPKGELEHPWLGELSLVFDTFSQNISTKRGVVSLSLSFSQAGVSPVLTIPAAIKTSERASAVESVSAVTFERDVESMGPIETNQTQAQYTKALNTLTDITSRLHLADSELKSINRAIHSAQTALNSVGSSPIRFTTAMSDAVDAVASGVQSETVSENAAADNARSAQELMLSLVDVNSIDEHFNVQALTGAVKMSRDVAKLEQEEQFYVADAVRLPSITLNDLQMLRDATAHCIGRVTALSTMESIALYDALLSMQMALQAQRDKLLKGSEAHRTVTLVKFQPGLTLAHDEFTEYDILTAINPLQHPLFMRGAVGVRDPS